MKKRLFILGALLLTATAGYSLWSTASEADKWNSLSVKRERAMLSRHLKSFQAFLNRQMNSDLTTAYGLRMSGHKENVVYAFGRIIKDGKDVGMISPRYYYHGWAEEPTSVDYNLVLNPSLVKSLGETEFNRLIFRTRKDQPVTSNIGDISWFSQIDEQGNVKVNLRAPYPTRWAEDIPDYDRGYRDTFYFEDFNRALRYMRKNVLVDEYAIIWLNLPLMNPPEERSPYEIGNATGYIQHKNGKLVGFEFGTSGHQNDRSFSLYISGGSSYSMGESKLLLSEEESRDLFKPEILKGDRITAADGISIQSSKDTIYPLHINGPFEALDKYRPKR